MSKFEVRLKELRIEKNLTQKMLAEVIGTSDDCIFSWEKGRAQPPAEMLIKLAEFFEVSTDYLLGLEDDFGNVAVQSSASGRTASQLSEEEQKLIEDYRGLGQPLKDLIKNMIQSWQGENTREKVGKK